MSRADVVAICWAPHEGRTEAYAEWLHAKRFNIHFGFMVHRKWIFAPFKYPFQWLWTWLVLLWHRPKIVYVLGSPPVAGFCVYAYGRLTGTPFLLDIPSPTIFGSKWRWTLPYVKHVSQHSAITIVDQERFETIFREVNAPTVILERAPRQVPVIVPDLPPRGSGIELTYVGTFSGDEPFQIVVEAARRLPDVRIYALGDTSMAKKEWLENVPGNLIFTGYLLQDVYWNQLRNADGVIVLTQHQYSLLGGAQDAMRVHKPLILSDQPVLRDYFTKGAVFVSHTPESMVTAIEKLAQQQAQFQQDMAELSAEREQRWRDSFQRVTQLVNRAVNGNKTG